MPPRFLVVGHVVQDLLPAQPQDQGPAWRLGGTVSYAALLAARLGLRAAALTAADPDMPLHELLPGVETATVPSDRTTRIRNEYTPGGRVQHIPQRGAAIGPDALPEAWGGADVVLLGPVAGEVDAALVDSFPHALVGVSAQGWLREVGPDGRVEPLPPQALPDALLRPAAVLFASDEDLPAAGAREVLEAWGARVDTLAFTHGERGAEVRHAGRWRRIEAFPARTVDPTGAGDVFATAFLLRYRETADPWQATRFAACASSFIVEGEGLTATPDRAAIEARLRAHPEIVCRPA